MPTCTTRPTLLQRVLRCWWFPLALTAAVFAVFFGTVAIGCGDDLIGQKQFEGMTIWQSALYIYQAWSGGVLKHIVTQFLLIYALPLWRVGSVLMVVLLLWSTCRLLGVRTWRSCAMVCAGFLLLPFSMHSDAGWVSTTVSYLWVLACGVYGLLPIRRVMTGERTPMWQWPLHLLALLFACSQEQMCVSLVLLYAVMLACALLWRKPRALSLMGPLLLCIAGLVVLLLCPGSRQRMATETSIWLPEFASFTLPQKVELGLSSSLYPYFFAPCFIALAVLGLLAAQVLRRGRPSWRWLCALFPCCVVGMFGLCSPLFSTSATVQRILDALSPTGTGIELTRPVTWLPLLLLLSCCVCVGISLFSAFQRRTDAWGCLLALAVGLLSRVIMGFSPTVWASGTRTFLFFSYAFLFVLAKLYDHLEGERSRSAALLCVCLMALVSQFSSGLFIHT